MVKVTRFTEREYIVELQRGESLGMLEAIQESIVDSLTDSGEDKAEAQAYVVDLCNRYID